MGMITTTPARGPVGPQGVPGATNATTLRGTNLDAGVATPADGALLSFNASQSSWMAVNVVDAGTW